MEGQAASGAEGKAPGGASGVAEGSAPNAPQGQTLTSAQGHPQVTNTCPEVLAPSQELSVEAPPEKGLSETQLHLRSGEILNTQSL